MFGSAKHALFAANAAHTDRSGSGSRSSTDARALGCTLPLMAATLVLVALSHARGARHVREPTVDGKPRERSSPSSARFIFPTYLPVRARAIAASLLTVLMLRAVPVLANGSLSFERPLPFG